MLIVALRRQSLRCRTSAAPRRQSATHRRSCPSALAGTSAVSREALTRSCSSAMPGFLRPNLLPSWRVNRYRRSSNRTELSARRPHRRSSLARRKAPRRAAVGCSTSRLRRLVLLRSSRSGGLNSRIASCQGRQPRSGQIRRLQFQCVKQCQWPRPIPRPNPSVEARPNGKAARPAPDCAYHPSAGRATSPSAPPHLER